MADYDVIIIGAGMSGMYQLHRLRLGCRVEGERVAREDLAGLRAAGLRSCVRRRDERAGEGEEK